MLYLNGRGEKDKLAKFALLKFFKTQAFKLAIKVNPVRDNGGYHVGDKISNGVNCPKGWDTKP